MRVLYGTVYVSREDIKTERLYKRNSSMHFSDLKDEIQNRCKKYNTVWYQIDYNSSEETKALKAIFKERGCVKPNKFRKTKRRKLNTNKYKNGNKCNV